MKLKPIHLFVIAVALIILVPTLLRYGDVISESILGKKPEEIETGTVAVTKKLGVSIVDAYAGDKVTGCTVSVYKGVTKQETLTDDNDGTYSSAKTYTSGDALTLKIVKSNSKLWYAFTVPRMTPQDAESATENLVNAEFFTISATLTDTLADGSGNSYTDGSTAYNFTTSGDLVTFTYSLFVGTDNQGYKSSYDPINQLNWYPVIYFKLSGTGYENVLVTGWDATFEKGSALYGYTILGDTEVTKYKVGNTYVYDGATSFTYSLDGTGLAAGSSITFQINVKYYSDPAYFQTKGSYGPDVLATDPAEHTLPLKA